MNTTLVASFETPYIGPSPFTRYDAPFFYGRERETADLTSMLISERIVMLNGPSGAGKTSLVRAGLLPKLTHRFRILPEVRMSCRDSNDRNRSSNRYIDAVFQSLMSDEKSDEALKHFVQDVRGKLPTDRALPEFFKLLQEAEFANERPMLVVFDQFEEVLSLNPTDQEAKQEFFRQLGLMLDHGTYRLCDEDENHEFSSGQQQSAGFAPWALFSMRDEFVGALEPFLQALPSRLRTRFHLTPLTCAQAERAICEPARKAGVTIHIDLAKAITKQLSQVQRLQKGTANVQFMDGLYVEPVFLQIVCGWLWKQYLTLHKENPSKTVLTLDDIELTNLSTSAQGDTDSQDLAGEAYVNNCLERFYCDAISGIADRKHMDQREIRLWIDKHLITSGNLRNQISLHGATTHGLSDDVFEELQGARLVRFDQRNGATWVELTHDRLVRPIRNSNERWYVKNLSPLQYAALNWDKAGRNKALLMSGAALDDANKWVNINPGVLHQLDREFLEASEAEQQAAEAEQQRHHQIQLEKGRWRRQLQVMLGALLCVVVIIAVMLTYLSVQQQKIAAQSAYTKLQWAKITSQNISIALLEANSQPYEALEKLIRPNQSLPVEQGSSSPMVQQQQALAQVLASWAGQPLAIPESLRIQSLVKLRCTGDIILAASREGVLAWSRQAAAPTSGRRTSETEQLKADQFRPVKLIDSRDDIEALSLASRNNGDKLLAAAGKQKGVSIVLFGYGDSGELAVINTFQREFDSPVTFIQAFNHRRESWVAVGCADGVLALWLIDREGKSEEPMTVHRHDGPLNAIAYQSGVLATGGEDDVIWVFMFDQLVAQLTLRDAPTTDRSATSTADILADGIQLREHRGGITDLVFSKDPPSKEISPDDLSTTAVKPPSFLASSSRDGTVRLWNVEAVLNSAADNPSSDSQSQIRMLPGAGYLAKLGLWESGNSAVLNKQDQGANSTGAAKGLWAQNLVEEVAIVDLALDPNDNYLVAGSATGNVTVWDFQRLVAKARPLQRMADLVIDNEIRQTYTAATDRIMDISMGSDPKWIAIADLGNAVHLWKFERSAERFRRSEVHKIVLSSPLQAVDLFGADRDLTLVSGTADGVIRMCPVNGEQLKWERKNLAIDQSFDVRKAQLDKKSISELLSLAQYLMMRISTPK